jgi:hypothetical protein
MQHRPAYAPEYFVDRRILFTIPYSMPGELIVATDTSGVQFPEAAFLHNVDKPFEIWRMITRLTGLTGTPVASAVIPDVQPETLEKRVRLSILDVAKNERITKAPQLVSSFQKANELSWEWDPRPYTIVRQEGLQITADVDALPTICVPDPAEEEACAIVPAEITFVRIEVTFQGYLLILEPPSAKR